MVSYTPPSHYLNVFNPADYSNTLSSDYYSKSEANARFVDVTSLQTVTGQKIFTSEIDSSSIVNSGSISTQTISTTGYSTTTNDKGLGDFMRLLLTDGVTNFRFTRLGTGSNGNMHLTNNFQRINGSNYAKDNSTLGCNCISFLQDGSLSFQTGSSTDTQPTTKMSIDTTGNMYITGDMYLGNSSFRYISGSQADFQTSAGVDINFPIKSGSTGALLFLCLRDMNGVYGYYGFGFCPVNSVPFLTLSSYNLAQSASNNPFLAGGVFGQSQVIRIATNSNTSLYYSLLVISL